MALMCVLLMVQQIIQANKLYNTQYTNFRSTIAHFIINYFRVSTYLADSYLYTVWGQDSSGWLGDKRWCTVIRNNYAVLYSSPLNQILNMFPPRRQVSVAWPGGSLITSVPLAFTWMVSFMEVLIWPFTSHSVPGCGWAPLNRQARQIGDRQAKSLFEAVKLKTFSGAHGAETKW